MNAPFLPETDPIASLAHDIIVRGRAALDFDCTDRDFTDLRNSAQDFVDEGFDGGDFAAELEHLQARAEAIDEYSTWAYGYEVRTGRDAPDIEQTRWGDAL